MTPGYPGWAALHTWCATRSAGSLRAVCTQMVAHATDAPCWAVVLLHCGVCHTCLQCHHTTPVCVLCTDRLSCSIGLQQCVACQETQPCLAPAVLRGWYLTPVSQPQHTNNKQTTAVACGSPSMQQCAGCLLSSWRTRCGRPIVHCHFAV